MAMTQQVNTRLILTVGAVSALLLVVISVGTQAWFQSEENREISEKWDASSSDMIRSLQINVPDHPLDQYKWTDKNHQSAIIPVVDAMQLMVEKNGQLPSTQPATAPSTEPAGAGK